jgi:hypothetical protein
MPGHTVTTNPDPDQWEHRNHPNRPDRYTHHEVVARTGAPANRSSFVGGRAQWALIVFYASGFFVTPLTINPASHALRSSGLMHDPLAHSPGRIVPYMLAVSALQANHPMHLLILVEADHASLHRTLSVHIQ